MASNLDESIIYIQEDEPLSKSKRRSTTPSQQHHQHSKYQSPQQAQFQQLLPSASKYPPFGAEALQAQFSSSNGRRESQQLQFQLPQSAGRYSSSRGGDTCDMMKKKKREESIIEWFDRSVESELQKRRYESLQLSPSELPDHSGMRHPHVVQSRASAIDIEVALRGERDTDLLDAVDKFAKAEAMVSFEGAVRAAEHAAAQAPPELAEEAAVAGAKGFQAEVTSIVNEKVPGVRPIEVIGYVGITRPKLPKRSNVIS